MSDFLRLGDQVLAGARGQRQRLQSDPKAMQAADRWAFLQQAKSMTGKPETHPGTRAIANMLQQGITFEDVFEELGINSFDYVAAAQEMSLGGRRGRSNMISIANSGNERGVAQTLPINAVAQRIARRVGLSPEQWRELIPGGAAWEVLSPQIRHRINYDAQNRDMRARLDEMGDLGETTNPFQLGPLALNFGNAALRQVILENGVDNLAADSDWQTFRRASQGSLVGTGRGLLGDDRTYDELSDAEKGLQVVGDIGLYMVAGAGVGGAVRGAAAGIRAARAMQSATSAGSATRIGQAFSRGMTRLNESALGRFGQAAARNRFYRATAPATRVLVGEFLEDAPIQASILAQDRARQTGRGELAEFLPALGETAKGYVNQVAALFNPNSDPGEKVMSAVLLLGMAAGAKTGADAARRIKKENEVWSQFPQLNIEAVGEKTLDRVVDLARSIQRQDPDAAVELRNTFEQVLATATTPEGNINARDLMDQQARLAQTIAGGEATGAVFGDESRPTVRAQMDVSEFAGKGTVVAALDTEADRQVVVPEKSLGRENLAYHFRHEIEHIAEGPMTDAINELSPAEREALVESAKQDIRRRYRGDEEVEAYAEYWTEPQELARYLTELALDSPRDLARLGLKGWRRFIPGSKTEIGKTLAEVSQRNNLGLYQGSRLSAVEVGTLVRANEVDLTGPRSSTKPTLPDSFVSTGKRKLTGRKKGVRKVTQAEQLKIRKEGHRAYEAALADGMTPEGAGNIAAATMQNSLGKLVSADFVRDVGERSLAKFAGKTKATAVAPAGRGDVDVVVWSDTQESEFASQGPAVGAIHGQSSPILAKKHRYSATIKESELTELKGSPETWDRQLRKRGVKGGIVEIEGQGEAVILSPDTKLKYVGEQGEGEVTYMWVTSERKAANNTRALKRKAKKKAQVALGDRLRQEASKAGVSDSGEAADVAASYGVWQGSGEPSFEVAIPNDLPPEKAAELELHILNESRKAGQDTYGVVTITEDGADSVEAAVLDMTPEAAWRWMIANHEGGTVIKRGDDTVVVVASVRRWGGAGSDTPLRDSIIATGVAAKHTIQAADVQFYGDKGGTKSYADREAELNQIIAGANLPQRGAGQAVSRPRINGGSLSSERLTRAAEAQAQKLAREAVEKRQILFSKAFGEEDLIDVDGTKRPRLNSNGKPIHPTEEGTKNFWRWFGNSQVVDEYGRPLVVYHAGEAAIKEFRIEMQGSRQGGRGAQGAFYFTTDRRGVQNYGHKVHQVYIKADPVLISPEDRKLDGLWKFVAMAKESGRDGVAFTDINDGGAVGTTYAVFDPSQIKSATGNLGSFDPNARNLLFSLDPASPGGASLNIAEDTGGTGMRFYSRLEAAIRALPFKELEERAGREIPGEPLDPDSPDPNKVVARDKKGNPIVNPKTGEVVLRSRRLGGTVPGKSLRDVVMEALVGPMKKAPNSEGFMMTSFPEAGAKDVSWKELAASGILHEIEHIDVSNSAKGKKASITKEDLIALAQDRIITFEIRQNTGKLRNSGGNDPDEFRQVAEESVFNYAREQVRDKISQIDEIDLGSYFDDNDDIELEASLDARDNGSVKLLITDYTLDEEVEVQVEYIEDLSRDKIEQRIAYEVQSLLVENGFAQSKADWVSSRDSGYKLIEGTPQLELTDEELSDLRGKLSKAVSTAVANYAFNIQGYTKDRIENSENVGTPSVGALQDWEKVIGVLIDSIKALDSALANKIGDSYEPVLSDEAKAPKLNEDAYGGTYTWKFFNGIDYSQALRDIKRRAEGMSGDELEALISQDVARLVGNTDVINLAGLARMFSSYTEGFELRQTPNAAGVTSNYNQDFTLIPTARLALTRSLEEEYTNKILVEAMRSTQFGKNVQSVLDEIEANWETISENSQYITAVDNYDTEYFEQEIDSEIEYYMDEYGGSDDPDAEDQKASQVYGELRYPDYAPGGILQDILGNDTFVGVELLINQGSRYPYWPLLHTPSTHFGSGNLVHLRAAWHDGTIVFYEFQSDAFMDNKRLNRTLVNSEGDTLEIAATPSMTNEVGEHNHPVLSNDMSWMMVRAMVSYAVANDMNKIVLISREGAMKTAGIGNPPKALYKDVPEAMRSFLAQFGEVEVDDLDYGTQFTISEEAADAVRKSGVPLMSKSFGEKPPGQAPGNAVWSRLTKALRGESAPQSQQDKAVATQKSPVTKARTKALSRPDTVGIESLGGKPARGLVRQGNRKLTQEDVEKLGSSAQRDDVDDLIASGQAIPEILRRSWADAEAAGATMTGDIRQVLRERVKIGAGLTDAEERYYQKVRLAIRDEIARLETALAKLGPRSKKRATLAQDRDELLAYATDMARNHIDARGNTARALAIGQLAASGARRGEVGVMRRIKALLGRELTPEEKTKASAIAVKAEVAYQAKVKADDSALKAARERVQAASASLPKKVTWNDLKRCLL